jgi:hypothetical protein
MPLPAVFRRSSPAGWWTRPSARCVFNDVFGNRSLGVIAAVSHWASSTSIVCPLGAPGQSRPGSQAIRGSPDVPDLRAEPGKQMIRT